MIPSFTSEKANTALSPATAMSAQATSPAPPPSAWPWTRATTGAGQRSIASSMPPKRVRVGDVRVEVELDRGAHPLDVGAGAEARPVAGEQHGARIADVDERLRELRDQRRVEGVAGLRPRERDPAAGRRRVRSGALPSRRDPYRTPRNPLRVSAEGLTPAVLPSRWSLRAGRSEMVIRAVGAIALRARRLRRSGAVPAEGAFPGGNGRIVFQRGAPYDGGLVEPLPDQRERNRARPAHERATSTTRSRRGRRTAS